MRPRPRAWCSTTTVVWARLATRFNAMLDAVDEGDSAQFSRDEILDPDGWVLLNFLMDSRTGLDRFRRFPRQQLPVDDGPDRATAAPTALTRYCKLPDVIERVELYFEHAAKAKAQLATLHHGSPQCGGARLAR